MMNNKNDNKDLEELMKKATEKSDVEYEHTEKKKDKSTKRVVMSAIAGMFIFGGILVSGYFMSGGSTDFVDKTKNPDWVDKNKEDSKESENEVMVSEIERPIELYEWAQIAYGKDEFWSREGIEEKVLKVAQEDFRNFYSSISWMRSGVDHGLDDPRFAKPYTNDVNKRYEKGSDIQNSRFSYALLEDYEKTFVVHIERLLNPTFGGWGVAQQYENQNGMMFGNLKDIFTENWWNENIANTGDYSRLPVFAEWAEGDWNDYDLYNEGSLYTPFFYGVIKETTERKINVEVLGSDEESQNIIKISVPVEYKAFNNDKEIVTTTGILELTMHSNLDHSEVENRVVVSDAKLTMDK